MNQLKSKRRKAVAGIDLPQPQDLMDDRATQPTQLFEGKSTLGADSLQTKMVEAAKEIHRLEYRLDSLQEYEEAVAKRVFCTPQTVLFLLRNEWIKVTEESLIQVGIKPRSARDILKYLRIYSQRNNRIGWVLPRIERQEGGAE